MFAHYPKSAGQIEFGLQVVLGILFLFAAFLYFSVRDIITGADAVERLAILVTATQILCLAFILSVVSTFFRRWMTNPPLILIWGALLLAAATSATCGSLLFISAL